MSEWLELEAWRFTTPAAFVREVRVLLDSTDYKLELAIKPTDRERFESEFENYRALGRLKMRVVYEQ